MTDVLKTLLGEDMSMVQAKQIALSVGVVNGIAESILYASRALEIEKLYELSFLVDRFIPFNSVTNHKLVIVCDPVINQLISGLVQLEIKVTHHAQIRGTVFLCLVTEEPVFNQKVYQPIQCFDVQPIIEQKVKIKSPLLKGLFE